TAASRPRAAHQLGGERWVLSQAPSAGAEAEKGKAPAVASRLPGGSESPVESRPHAKRTRRDAVAPIAARAQPGSAAMTTPRPCHGAAASAQLRTIDTGGRGAAVGGSSDMRVMGVAPRETSAAASA